MGSLADCDLFDERKGFILLISIMGGAMLFYMLSFALVAARSRASRSGFVFFLDAFKLIAGLVLSWVVYIYLATPPDAGGFSVGAWYVVTFIVENVVAVPLGVIFAKILSATMQLLTHYCGCLQVKALHHFGRYEPTAEEDVPMLGGEGSGGPMISWWFVQLIFWGGCVVGSRVLGFMIVPAVLAMYDDPSTTFFYKIAQWADNLDYDCDKALYIVIAVVAVVDLLHIYFVDTLMQWSNPAGPLLPRGTRVRALWKYTAQHEDELSFEANEIITIEGEAPDEEQWYKGSIGRRHGLIPATYVEVQR